MNLGHADNATVAKALADGVGFSDLFETADMNDDGTCPEGFSASNAEGRAECLKVKPGMESLASRLETRRYASMLGAATEFRKEEGIALDAANKMLFVAMSEIGNGMEDNVKDGKYDKGRRNDIRLSGNDCGAVYALPLATDTAIGSDYVAASSKGLVAGKPTEYDAESPYAGNTCDIDGIANPDNVAFMDGYGTLIIGSFSPASGSTDDVLIRLPEAYRQDRDGNPDWTAYAINLAIVEALIHRADVAIDPVDEARYGVDLDKDGKNDIADHVAFDWAPLEGRNMSYVGRAGALQDFAEGRAALLSPAKNIHRAVEQDAPTGIADSLPRW